NLADIHARGHAERIEHDIHGGTVRHAGHVFDRHDLGDNTLVPVAAGHLVARLQPPLHRQIDLYHLLHARRQLVALGQLLLLLFERLVEQRLGLRQAFPDAFQLRGDLVVGDADVEPAVALDLSQVGLGDLGAFRELLRAAVCRLADYEPLQPFEGVVLDDAQLIGKVLLVALQLVVDDLLRALVALDALAREPLPVDPGARLPRRNGRVGVFAVGSFFAEYCAQQLPPGRHLRLALGRPLPPQPGARLDFRADVDNARFVQAGKL